MVVGSCKKLSRMGYYLALLHRFSNKVAKTLGTEIAEEVPPTPIVQPTQVVETVEQPDLTPLEPPETVSYDAQQVGYQDQYQQPQPQQPVEPINYQAEQAALPQEEVGFDKSALFDALQQLGGTGTTEQTPPQQPNTGVDQNSLMEALKPKESAQPGIPFQQAPSQPPTQFVPAAADDDDDVFKISDKDAVLEALKVLGWVEPEE